MNRANASRVLARIEFESAGIKHLSPEAYHRDATF